MENQQDTKKIKREYNKVPTKQFEYDSRGGTARGWKYTYEIEDDVEKIWKNTELYKKTGFKLTDEGVSIPRRYLGITDLCVERDSSTNEITKISFEHVGSYKRSYSMEFRDGKEFNGEYKEHHINSYLDSGPRYKIENGKFEDDYFLGDDKKVYQNGNLVATYYGDSFDIAERWAYDDNGILNGPNKAYNKNGNLKIECTYKNGNIDGEYKEFDSNGNVVIKQQYENGKCEQILSDGTKLSYYNGVLSKEFLPDGTVKEFYDNGQISAEKLPDGSSVGWYVGYSKKFAEKPNGSRQEWHINGKLSKEVLCSDDKRKISEARYDENGNRTHFEHYDKDGKDDTRLYLAKQKVAKDNVDKGTEKGKVQKKLNPISKAWKLHKALKEIDASK